MLIFAIAFKGGMFGFVAFSISICKIEKQKLKQQSETTNLEIGKVGRFRCARGNAFTVLRCKQQHK
jgi:hypothetical protein